MQHVLEQIKAYTKGVEKEDPSCTIEICTRCGKSPGEFKIHDRRKRIFLVIVGQLVQKIITILFRWKCPLCGETFTLYPDFALPNKRYVREDIFKRSLCFVENENMSYRQVVKDAGKAIFHGNPEKLEETISKYGLGAIGSREFAHSTVHSWLTTISGFKEATNKALHMIRTKSSTSKIFRKIQPVFPRKYRSRKRKEILQMAFQFLKTENEYKAIFKISIFPHFKTACCFF